MFIKHQIPQIAMMVFTSTIIAVILSSPVVNALGPGEACAFNMPSGAPLEIPVLKNLFPNVAFGHVAWGFQVGNSTNYIFGSDDGPSNGNNGDTKKWSQSNGTRANMLSWFKSNGYAYYNCEPVQNSAVGSAQTMIATVKAQKYQAFGNNCLDDTIAILTAYNAQGVPSVKGKPIAPNWWFDHLASDGNSSGGRWSTTRKNL